MVDGDTVTAKRTTFKQRSAVHLYIYSENIDIYGYSEGHQDSVGGSAEIFGKIFHKPIQPNPTSCSPFSSPSSPRLSVHCKMGQKRLTRAQVQQELDQILAVIRSSHSYAGDVQAQVDAQLARCQFPPNKSETDSRILNG